MIRPHATAADLLARAVQALHERTYYAAFPENPAPEVYGADADAQGRAAFAAHRGRAFAELHQGEPQGWAGQEESPFEQQPLGVRYPYYAPETLVRQAQQAFEPWRKLRPAERAELLVASLDGVRARFFEIAYATMHTAGQGFAMAFQAAGPHAADRALEAIAAGYEEQTRFPEEAQWDKPMGKYTISLRKTWRPVPKGVGLVVGCATFPTWNTVPGLYASLVTGNPVIVKPHPGAVLPMAIVVAEVQKALAARGLPPTTCQLAVDADDRLIAKELAEHPAVKLIDYTGGSAFGTYLEGLQARGKTVFTEKTGVNSVILDSCDDLGKVVQNLAFSVSLYSGQMCTAPQNFFIPADGVRVAGQLVSYADVVQQLAAAVQALVTNPKAAPHVLGALQSPATQQRAEQAAGRGHRVALAAAPVANPAFEQARTCAPALYEVEAAEPAHFGQELFGPILLAVKTKDSRESLRLAAELARSQGALSCAAYTTDAAFKEEIMDQMGLAGTPVSFNLTGGIYVNQAAAFSDFHGTGGNPAGTASYANPEFVVRRFSWVGFREPA